MQQSQIEPSIDCSIYCKTMWSLCDVIIAILDQQLKMNVLGDEDMFVCCLSNFLDELITPL